MKKMKVLIILIVSVLFLSACTRTKDSKLKEEAKKERVELTQEEKVELTQEEKVEQFMKNMPIEEKIGQLFIMDIRQDLQGNPQTTISDDIKARIDKYKVGGIILFKENIEQKEQTQYLIQALQQTSKLPLWISVDEEGGTVSRVGKNPNMVKEPFLEAAALGRSKDINKVYEEGKRMGSLLYELGFNMDFAPVADIFNNPENTVIGTRSFGTTAEEVAPMVISFAKGLQEEKIMPVIKHFPGHGNTQEDSHEGFAYSHKTLEMLETEEMVPFKKGIEFGIEGLMIGHLLIKDVDETYPASVSKKWGDYIAESFDTKKILLITDAMNMGAIAQHYTSEEASLLSLLSGYDIVLMPEDMEAAYNGVLKAFTEGKLTEERIDKSVKKILLKKIEHNILNIE